MKLTQTNIAKLACEGGKKDQIFFDDELAAFGLRVREGGSRKFVVHLRQGSAQRRYTIGSASVLTLEEARKKARRALMAFDDGQDPATEKATKRTAASLLFGAVAAEYLDACKKTLRPRTHEECTRPFEQGMETAPRARAGRCGPRYGCGSVAGHRED